MATYTYSVQVVSSGGSNVYQLTRSGGSAENNPILPSSTYATPSSGLFAVGDVLVFDLSHSSNAAHPLGIGPHANQVYTNASNTAYGQTSGVVYNVGGTTYSTFSLFSAAYITAKNANASAAAAATFTISASHLARVYYFCGVHSGMGNVIKITGTNSTTVSITGLQGATGPAGAAATIAPGTATALVSGATPTVANSGSTSAAVFDFGIPAGPAGPQGAPGQKGETGGFVIRHKYESFNAFQADSDPETNHNFTVGDLAFIGGDVSATEYGRMYLYKGANNGDPGSQNNAWQFLVDLSVAGIQGPAGVNASIELATTHNVTDTVTAAGVTNTGTQQAAVLQFTIPRGPTGLTGGTGLTGQTGATGASGTDGTDGVDGKSVNAVAISTNADDATKFDLTFTMDDAASTTHVATFDKPLAATITPGTVTGLATGASPTVTNSGNSNAAIFDFGIPTGPQGVGITSAAITTNSTDTSKFDLTLTLTDASTQVATFDKPPGISNVVAVDVDTIKFQLVDGTFTSNIDLPRGLTGPSGTLGIGTITTVASGNNAAVALDTTSTYNASNQATHGVFNFSVPKGRGFVSAALADHPSDNTKHRITFTSDDSTSSTTTVDFNKATDGVDGNGTGFTGGSYNSSTGVVTFTSNDGLGFTTGDLRGTDGGGASSLNGLSDVVITGTPSSGQILQHNGTNFINATDPSLINAIALG